MLGDGCRILHSDQSGLLLPVMEVGPVDFGKARLMQKTFMPQALQMCGFTSAKDKYPDIE
jgi:hypothetical protein